MFFKGLGLKSLLFIAGNFFYTGSPFSPIQSVQNLWSKE